MSLRLDVGQCICPFLLGCKWPGSSDLDPFDLAYFMVSEVGSIKLVWQRRHRTVQRSYKVKVLAKIQARYGSSDADPKKVLRWSDTLGHMWNKAYKALFKNLNLYFR